MIWRQLDLHRGLNSCFLREVFNGITVRQPNIRQLFRPARNGYIIACTP